MRAEAPEGVLVRAHDAQVLPVAVEVEDLAEQAVVDDLLHVLEPRVVDEQVVDHQDAVAGVGQGGHLASIRAGQRERLLDEDVLAGFEDALRERGVRGNRCGDDHRVRLGIAEDVIELPREARGGVRGPVTLEHLLVQIAAPPELGLWEPREVAGEVGAPVVHPHHADAHR